MTATAVCSNSGGCSGTAMAVTAVSVTIQTRTATISDRKMAKWEAITEMTMTTTEDKKMKKWQLDFNSFDNL